MKRRNLKLFLAILALGFALAGLGPNEAAADGLGRFARMTMMLTVAIYVTRTGAIGEGVTIPSSTVTRFVSALCCPTKGRAKP